MQKYIFRIHIYNYLKYIISVVNNENYLYGVWKIQDYLIPHTKNNNRNKFQFPINFSIY